MAFTVKSAQVVPNKLGGDQSYRELIPYVNKATETGDSIELTVPTDETDDLIKALRKAGLAVNPARTVRIESTEDTEEGDTVVSFRTSNKIHKGTTAADEPLPDEPTGSEG